MIETGCESHRATAKEDFVVHEARRVAVGGRGLKHDATSDSERNLRELGWTRTRRMEGRATRPRCVVFDVTRSFFLEKGFVPELGSSIPRCEVMVISIPGFYVRSPLRIEYLYEESARTRW